MEESERRSEEKKNEIRQIPQDSLDLQMLTLNTEWGRENIPKELKDKLSKISYKFARDEEGNIIKNENGTPMILVDKEGIPLYDKNGLWQLLGFYTRDMRLGNLSKAEHIYVMYYIDLANDDLRVDYTQAFLICLSRAVTVLETSQSKKGFLRKLLQTFIEHKTSVSGDVKKRNLFGMNKGGAD
jgi:hypothetical protein